MRIVTLLVALLLAAAGCSEENAPLRDKPVLSAADVDRLIAALTDLRTVAKSAEAATDAPAAAHFGLGITAFVGEARAEPIVQRHGFASCQEFESALGYVQLALNRVLLGPDSGLAGMGKVSVLEAELRAARQKRDVLKSGGTPDFDEGTTLIEVERRILELEDQIEERKDVAAAMKEQSGDLPAETVRAVEQRRDALMQLLLAR